MSFPFILLLSFSLFIPGLAYHCEYYHIQCSSSSDCISMNSLCDGQKDCTLGDDEEDAFCAAYTETNPHTYCPKGDTYCTHHGACYSWLNACNNNDCSKILNQTICDAIHTRKLPSNPVPQPTPDTKSEESLSEEDLQSFLALVNSSTTVENNCPMFYTNVSGVCYAFLPFKMTWPEAVESCASISGILADPENLNFMKLVNYLHEKVYTSDFWIGGLFDIVFNDWRWHTGESMPTETPYWFLTYKETCETRKLSENLGKADGCYHYHQTPTESSAGHCAAMDYKNMFYFSNEDCSEKKKPICLHQRF